MFVQILDGFGVESITIQGGSTLKPTIEEVLRYAKPQLMKFISKFAGELPDEQKDEIEQSAYVRLIEAYIELDPDAGWKSFVFNHCRGAVLDYLKFGKGFQEGKWSLTRPEEHGARHVNKIHQRVFMETSEGEDLNIDQVLGENGVFGVLDLDSPRIKWDLLARLASRDEALLCFLKWLRGFDLEEIGAHLCLSRSRVGQLIVDVINRYDDPKEVFCPEYCQTAWALGIASRLCLEDRDQSEVFGFKIGWGFQKVELDATEPKFPDMQMDLLSYAQA